MRYHVLLRLLTLTLQVVVFEFAALQCVWSATALDADVEAARELAGKDPAAARTRLGDIRRRAVAERQPAARLAADEAECRLLTDIDSSLARKVAEVGLAEAARAEPSADVLQASARLAACGAGALLDLGELARGSKELDELIASAPAAAPLPPQVAMALLERGLHRSRRGELIPGQADLLAACAALQRLQLPKDLELCESHLANHYKRVGDTDEALRLLVHLLEGARERGASADIGIYLYGLAQVRAVRQEWPPALAAFEETLSLAEATRDASGIAYAEHGIALALHHLGRTPEALLHVDRSLRVLSNGSDPVQALRVSVMRATLLNALHRPTEAATALAAVKAPVSRLADELLQLDWLRAQAQAQAQLGHWQEAYASLDKAAVLDERQREQRLSEQNARLRMQFNRERDTAELDLLRRADEQRRQLVQTQALALALFVALLAAAILLATRKLREARQMRQLAMVDELTGLPNRRAVLARLEGQFELARRSQRPLSVLMVDVDHFKSVNDTHGHPVGDQVLAHLARVLQGCLRNDDWVGRVGGEEFLVVLPDTTPEHAVAVAQRMRGAVENAPYADAQRRLPLTVSIGAAHRARQPLCRHLLEQADQALYAAKTQGRNRVCAAPA